MRIGTLATRLGTTPHAIRFYEREGLLPAPVRGPNGYRDYTTDAAARLRLLIGLRQLDLPLEQAAELATMCVAGRCDEVSAELRAVLAEKRREVARRVEELRYLDQRLAHLASQLGGNETPRTLITLRKEEGHADPL